MMSNTLHAAQARTVPRAPHPPGCAIRSQPHRRPCRRPPNPPQGLGYLQRCPLAATGFEDDGRFPWATIADHRVDGHEQLAGYGRQRSFFRFAPAAFYERLVGRGNPKKAALAAVARKLLVAINAMIRDGRGWQLALIVQPSCC